MNIASRTERLRACKTDVSFLLLWMLASYPVFYLLEYLASLLPFFLHPEKRYVFPALVILSGLVEAFTGISPGKLTGKLVSVTNQGQKGDMWFYNSRFLIRYLPVWVILGTLMTDLTTHWLLFVNGLVGGVWLLINGAFFLSGDVSSLHDVLIGGEVMKHNDLANTESNVEKIHPENIK